MGRNSGSGNIAAPDSGRLYAAGGEATFDRRFISSNSLNLPTGQVYPAGFVALRTETITNIVAYTGVTAAAATPTVCQMAVYRFDNSGNATLVANTANDTTLFSAAFTRYQRSLGAGFTKQAGVNYAVVPFVVTAVAVPTLLTAGNNGGITALGASLLKAPSIDPFATGPFGALPATILAAGWSGGSGNQWFMELLP